MKNLLLPKTNLFACLTPKFILFIHIYCEGQNYGNQKKSYVTLFKVELPMDPTNIFILTGNYKTNFFVVTFSRH